MHQETRKFFFGIFVRKIKRTGVQIARTEVCIAKTQKRLKKNQKPTGIKPKTHAAGGSGSSRCLRSNGQGFKRLDRVLTDPVQRAYIKGIAPVRFIFSSVSLSSLIVLSSSLILFVFSG